MGKHWIPDGNGGFVEAVRGEGGWLVLGALLLFGTVINIIYFGVCVLLALFVGFQQAFAMVNTLLLASMGWGFVLFVAYCFYLFVRWLVSLF